MVNNISNGWSDLMSLAPHSATDKNHVLTTELRNIAPEIAQDLLSQFDEEKVEQLLHQQLTSLITISKQPKVSNYQYSDKELALLTVMTSQQEGLLKNENSEKLMARLNKSVTDIYAAYANTSDILANLGQLGHQQKSFLASSEQRVERALSSYIEQTKRIENEDDDNYRFELSVKTKEGDVINITFNSSQGYDEEAGKTVDGFSLSYQVEGSLSEDEHQALTEVLSGVGEMADEFFKLSQSSHSKYVPEGQVDMSLNFLADFDHRQLSGFDVSFSTSEGQKTALTENQLDLSYQVDQDSQQQALAFNSKAGIKHIDFSLDMSTLGGKDEQQMQQYLAILDNNIEDSRHNSTDEDDKSSAFGKNGDESMQQGFALFKGAFANMSSAANRYSSIESIAAKQFINSRAMVADLVDNMIVSDPRYQGLGSETENPLGEGISTLADFDANFSFSIAKGDLRPKSTVELSQITKHAKSGELSGVTQSKTAKSHFDYQSTRPDYYDKNESYTIGTAVKNNALVGLDQQHQVDVDKKTFQLIPGTSQYQLKMELTEKISNESSIRLIDDIWLEKTENQHTLNKRERIGNEGKPEDFKKTNHHSYNKLISIIGDLDKLANNIPRKREYLIELGKVNFFIGNK